jgi:hypothetical protein
VDKQSCLKTSQNVENTGRLVLGQESVEKLVSIGVSALVILKRVYFSIN